MNSYFDSVASSWDNNPMKVERAAVTAARVKATDFASYNSVVDFGSGTGLLGVQLREIFTHVHLADSSQQMLRVAQTKLSQANINNISTHHVASLSELTSTHSAIVTLMALHHIPDLDGFFSDAYHALESRGTLIIADLYKENGSFHEHHPGFVGHNGFDVSELEAISARAGFSVQSVEQYYEIWRENDAGAAVSYPLFFFVAHKSE